VDGDCHQRKRRPFLVNPDEARSDLKLGKLAIGDKKTDLEE
jgi:hypothetical protein